MIEFFKSGYRYYSKNPLDFVSLIVSLMSLVVACLLYCK